MTIRATAKRGALALLLAGGVAITATGAGADNKPAGRDKAGRDSAAILAEIQSGKATKKGEKWNLTAVWDGCRFHYVKDKVTTYVGTQNEHTEISTDPEPVPPRDPKCGPDRNPTAAEVWESRARVEQSNGPRPAGAPYTPIRGVPGT